MSDNYPVDAELGRQAERIEALEQAHAELAAKVEQMISKAGTDCDLCEGRGWSINVPSQSMYPCRWCAGKGKVNIAALESPAPAPAPVCANPFTFADSDWVETVPTAEPAPLDPVCNRCGHVESHHVGSIRICSWATCSCDEFVDGRDGAR